MPRSATPAGSADYTVLIVFLAWGLVAVAMLAGRVAGGSAGEVSLPLPALLTSDD